ncbi:MAG: serine/threonine protein kinase [Deltaproteobacteria bacterium]|nr:serine/threonine protein kinase [Deltaproteobacteria bacterium]
MAPTERLVAAGFAGKLVAGRYKLERMLGAGAVGEVWLAEHLQLRKRYALKILDARIATPEIVARFEREAVAAANVTHPAIAAGTDFGRDEDGTFFLVLEYVAGQSLRKTIKEGPLPPARALEIARRILGAAGAAHAKGVVHRDLKPENVMLADQASRAPESGPPSDARTAVKVLDFGIAKVDPKQLDTRESVPPPGKNLTRAGRVYGTPVYMPPEQAHGEIVDERADLYAIGVIVFEMITGKLPFEGEPLEAVAHQLAEVAPALETKAPAGVTITPELETFVARLLERSRDARPADVPAALALLEAAERSLSATPDEATAAAPAVAAPTAKPSARLLAWARPRRAWVAGAIALVLLAPLLFVMLRGGAPTTDEEEDARPRRKPAAAAHAPSTSVSASASAAPSASTSAAPKPTSVTKKSSGNEKGFGKLKGLFK